MKYVLLTALAGGLIAAPALAQDWVLDREASSVEFEARNSGAALTGHFEDFEADITLDPEDLPGASIDARVSTPSLDGISDSSIRSALRGGGGLGVDAHPDARFVSDEIVATETGYEARGTLTLKGQSHDASLPFTLEIGDGRAVAQGELEIDRTRYDVGSSWDTVGDSVIVRLHIEADAAD